MFSTIITYGAYVTTKVTISVMALKSKVKVKYTKDLSFGS